MQRRPLSPRSSLLLTALLAVFTSCRRASEGEGTATAPPSADQNLTIVGHAKCAECHQEIAGLHHASGHSRTFALAQDSPAAKRLCGKKLFGGKDFGTYEYLCDAEGLAVELPERFRGRLMPLDLALGSGQHAVTFVSLTRDRAGRPLGIEHRMTWYASDGEFDITPGQQELLPVADGAFFGYVIEESVLKSCVDCHTTTAEVIGMELKNLYGGVQCERCHGPASAHVAAAERGGNDEAKRLMHRDWTAAEEIKACGTCHRTIDDIAAERAERYPKSVVRFQPIGLVKSRCYTESKGDLRCTTCHDPHGPPSTRTLAQQVATCVSCHQAADQTTCPVSPADDCIRCHMPAIDLVRGIKFHDHWIRVRNDDGQPSGDDKLDPDPHSIRPPAGATR